MPYSPPSGADVDLEFGSGVYLKPPAPSVNLELDTPLGNIRQASLGVSHRVGTPGVTQAPRLRAQGHDSLVFGRAEIERVVLKIFPPSIDNTIVVGTPSQVSWRQFVTPAGIAEPIWYLGTGRVRLVGGYNPPIASNVVLNWFDQSAYSPAPAFNAILEFGALGSGRIVGVTLFNQGTSGTPTIYNVGIRPTGIPPGPTLFGTPVVIHKHRFLQPAGLAPGAFGTASIILKYRVVEPSGWATGAIGTPLVLFNAQSVTVGGIAPLPQTGPNNDRGVPSPVIGFRVRYAAPTGIAAGSVGTASVTHDLQFVQLATYGIPPGEIGTHLIAPSVRYIDVPFIFALTFGATRIARRQIAQMEGWSDSVVSADLRVDINLQRIGALSGAGVSSRFGDLSIRTRTLYISVLGWPSSVFPALVIRNKTQYVQAGMYALNLDPTGWAPYTPYVENRNRVVAPGGWRSSRFSFIGHDLRNNAQLLAPDGIDSLSFGPLTFLGYRNRAIDVPGWDGFYSTHYTVVYNGARIVAPQGWVDSRFGVPSQVLNANRTLVQQVPYGGESFGTAFIAYRVRTLQQLPFNDVPSGFPEVRFNPHPIAPAGIEPRAFGAHTVDERFTIVRPNSFNQTRFGDAFFQNRSRVVRPFPSEQSLYGVPTIFNRNAHVTIGIGDQSRLGAHFVAYRTKTLIVAPFSAPSISVFHRIRNNVADPPVTQWITLLSGMFTETVGAHQAGAQQIFPEGIFEGNIPRPRVQGTTIAVGLWGYPWLSDFGDHTVRLRLQYILPKQIPAEDNKGDSDKYLTKPRLTPHTIYAPGGTEATQQARDNHPGAAHIIDENKRDYSGVSFGQGWPFFGRPAVSNQFRTILPSGAILPNGWSSRIGEPELTLKNRRIYPVALRSLRMGLPSIPGVPQTIYVTPGIASAAVVGVAKVALPVVPGASPTGFVATTFGVTRIDLFNRVVAPEGITHRGNPQQNLTSPWGVPTVGYPRMYTLGGYSFTLWGTASVTHKIRNVYPTGWNSLSLEGDEIDSFNDRMRVRRINTRSPLVTGIPSTLVFGTPDIGARVRTIFARGVGDYAIGTPQLTSTSTITPTGWDSFVAGNIDRWEAGKIKPYGPDMSEFGYPRMGRVVHPEGFDTSAFGTPRYATPVYAVGIPAPEVVGPTVIDPFGCGNHRAIASPSIPMVANAVPAITVARL